MGKMYDYRAKYSQYLELRESRRQAQIKAYKDQQKMIAESKEFIERFWHLFKANQVNSVERMLENLSL